MLLAVAVIHHAACADPVAALIVVVVAEDLGKARGQHVRVIEARLQIAEAAAACVVERIAQREGVGELGHVAGGGVLPVAHPLAATLVDHLLEDVEGAGQPIQDRSDLVGGDVLRAVDAEPLDPRVDQRLQVVAQLGLHVALAGVKVGQTGQLATLHLVAVAVVADGAVGRVEVIRLVLRAIEACRFT